MLSAPSAPWPQETSTVHDSYEEHTPRVISVVRRATVPDPDAVAKAKTDCEIHSSNAVVSCFPTAKTVIQQHQLAAFVWNSNLPDLTQRNRVDIYLFHGDSQEQILSLKNQLNPRGEAGSITVPVNDSWWGDRGADWAGQDISYLFYWMLSPSGHSLTEGIQKPQATFSAVQTTYADFVIASMSSASASKPTVISSSSSSASGLLTTTTVTTVGGPGPQLQSTDNSSFPIWAIIVLTLAIVATLGCVILIIIYSVRRRRLKSRSHANGSSSRNMTQIDKQPAAAAAVAASDAIPYRPSDTSTERRRGAVSPDSTISRTADGIFSIEDAALMADAFRAALRQPDFAERPLEEGESPVEPQNHDREREALMRELGDEGTYLSSVNSVRDVRVESSEGGDTTPRSSYSPHPGHPLSR